MPGETVRFILSSNNSVLDSQVTDAAGDCTLTDLANVGQLRCVTVVKAGWSFAGCQNDSPYAPCLPNPICVTNHNNVYFYWGSRDMQGNKLRVFGGPRGFVNPNLGEKATISITPGTSGPVTVRIYTLRGKLVAFREARVANVPVSSNPLFAQTAVEWNGRDADNKIVASGIYVVRVDGAGVHESTKIAIVKN